MSEHIKILIVGNGFGGTYALKNLNKLLCNDKRIIFFLPLFYMK
jgi:NADH dehydrogenase FAD-containing subunit